MTEGEDARSERQQPSLRTLLDERRHLLNLAFRMLGTTADAEDVVQETYTRWYRLTEAERAAIEVPQAWLTRVAGRICLDVLASARHRRELYVGEWLPEPLAEAGAGASGAGPTALGSASDAADPLDRVTLDESVSMALLVLLESLTPAERVAFVLHDVFALPFEEIADIVGRTPQACRKLASTARRRIREGRRREATSAEHSEVVRAFLEACRTGDVPRLASLLDPAATTRSDGGGKIRAALNPVVGADRTIRFLLGVLAKPSDLVPSLEPVNGRTGVVFREPAEAGGRVASVVSVDVREGVITDVWIVLNPDKLRTWND